MGHADRIAAAKKAVLPNRLDAGAEILGRLWREGTRCEKGWSALCHCSRPTDFCMAKARWCMILRELHGDWPNGVQPGDSYAIIEAMTLEQFDLTQVTVQVTGPKDKPPIKIGKNGTSWWTLAYLAIEEIGQNYQAWDDVVKIQGVFK